MTWQWRPAQGPDVTPLVEQSERQLTAEIDTVFRVDPIVYSHEMTRAIVDQFYAPATACLRVAERQDQILGYVWAERGHRMPWSAEEMVNLKVIHVNLDLPVRTRLVLCEHMLIIAEAWARDIGVPIVASGTIRDQQRAFLRLHERRGYVCRGSVCYKRVDTAAATPADSLDPD